MIITCNYCHTAITGEYTVLDKKNYHTGCYQNHVQERCTLCHTGINGKYFTDEWGSRVCDKHITVACDSCGRIVLPGTTLAVQGRQYCNTCSTTTASSASIAPAYSKISALFNTYGIHDVLTDVPVLITDSATIAQQLRTNDATNTLGVTSTTTSGGFFGKQFHHTIYLLAGMPLVEFEAVLAHELLHTWLNENEIQMPSPETEGFCNIGAYILLTNAKTKHAEILKKQMVENPDPIYGEGFMKMLREVQSKGWIRFIDEIKGR